MKEYRNRFFVGTQTASIQQVGSVANLRSVPKPTLGLVLYWLGGYLIYSLFHIVAFPLVLVRFLGRIRHGRYRGVIFRRLLGGTKPPREGDWTLIIATSMGETRTAVQAADEISRECSPDVAVLTQLPRLPNALRANDSIYPIGYAPFNSPFAALLALWQWRPKQILFVEFSGNYHLAFAAKILRIPTALINVNLPEDRKVRLLRKPLGKWQFSFVDTFFVQASCHARRLEQLDVHPDRIYVSGISLGAFESPVAGSSAAKSKWQSLLQIPDGTHVVLAGSTYHDEELELIAAMKILWEHHPDAVLILAPRQLGRRGGADSALLEAKIDFDRRSQLDRFERAASVILLDTVGELRELYSIATVAHIGGTLVDGVGGHTPLEALSSLVPMTLGPYFRQQEAAVQLVSDSGVAEICANASQLAAVWNYAIEHPELKSTILELAQRAAQSRNAVFADLYRLLTSA